MTSPFDFITVYFLAFQNPISNLLNFNVILFINYTTPIRHACCNI